MRCTNEQRHIRVVARVANEVLREAVSADDRRSVVLGVADLAAGEYLVATSFGLWLPDNDGVRRIGWHLISKAVWDRSSLLLTEAVSTGTAGETVLLSFERWGPGMPWEVSTGKSVLTGELTVYPAPPAGARQSRRPPCPACRRSSTVRNSPRAKCS